MKHIYMSLSISISRNGNYADCTLWERIDDGKMTYRTLSLAEARKMQWELVKAGAERTFRPNWFDNAISHVDVDYWMRH